MNAIQEAHRYLDNARQLLSEKAGKLDGYYQDPKYVKMAGHTAYAGLLVALDAYFGGKKKGRTDVSWYQKLLAEQDKKALSDFNSAYSLLHLDMGYDGVVDADIAQLGFTKAEKLLEWLEKRSN